MIRLLIFYKNVSVNVPSLIDNYSCIVIHNVKQMENVSFTSNNTKKYAISNCSTHIQVKWNFFYSDIPVGCFQLLYNLKRKLHKKCHFHGKLSGTHSVDDNFQLLHKSFVYLDIGDSISFNSNTNWLWLHFDTSTIPCG